MSKRLIYLVCLGLLLGLVGSVQAATILVVSDDAATGSRDTSLVDFLEGLGYDVDISGMDQAMRSLNDTELQALDDADLIIVSRRTSSGDYDDPSDNGHNERAKWNEIETPLILMGG